MKKLLHVFLYLCITTSYAQTGRISGKVTTSDGLAAHHVNVSIKGSANGTITNEKGVFELKNLQPGKYTIRVSFVGLRTQEIETEVAPDMDTVIPTVVLLESSQELSEIIISVAKGYKAEKISNSLRLTTPLIEAPQNIQIVTNHVLADQQVFDILDGVTRNVSGAQRVEHWDNYARINMRGSQITAFRNGMNVQMPWGPLAEDMSMVERIEFVKGPAGFMLSNGEPGGFYNVLTKKPTGAQNGELSFSLGSFNNYRTTVDLEGALNKDHKLLYRVNVMGNLKGSHRDFEFNNRYSIAPVLKYVFNEQTSVTVEFTQQYLQMSAIGSNYAFSKQKYGDLPANFTTAEPNLDPSTIKDRSVLGIIEHRLNDNWKITTQLAYFHYDQEGQSLWPRSITEDGYMQRGVSIWDALGINKAGQVFVTGKKQTGAITHRVLAGVDMSDKNYFADWMQGGNLGDQTFNVYDPEYRRVPASEFPTYDRSLSIRERGVQYSQSYSALYAQDELGFFNNKARLTLAGRYTKATNVNPYSGNTKDKKFTPRLGLSISINPNMSAYAVYDKTFLPNPGADYQGKSFDPITGGNLEAGLKKDFFDNNWNVNFSAFQITKNNILVLDTEHPDPSTGQLVFSKQVGQTRTRGVELDLHGEIIRNLDVVVNYALTDARVTKDTQEERVGVKVAGTSRHIQNLWLTYRLATGPLKGLGASLGYQWQIERSSWFIFDGTDKSLPDYFRMDAGLSWRHERLNATLNINNLLNKYLFSGSPYGGMYYWQAEPLRNTRLTLAYNF